MLSNMKSIDYRVYTHAGSNTISSRAKLDVKLDVLSSSHFSINTSSTSPSLNLEP